MRLTTRQHSNSTLIWSEHFPVTKRNIDAFVQDCSNPSASALDLLHSCTKLSVFLLIVGIPSTQGCGCTLKISKVLYFFPCVNEHVGKWQFLRNSPIGSWDSNRIFIYAYTCSCMWAVTITTNARQQWSKLFWHYNKLRHVGIQRTCVQVIAWDMDTVLWCVFLS